MARIFFPKFKKGKQGIDIDGGTILDAARKLDIQIPSECGSKGICGKCRVRVEGEESLLSSRTRAERKFNLDNEERLACQTRLTGSGNIRVFIKQTGKYTILSDSIEEEVTLSPLVYRRKDKVLWKDEVLDEFGGSILGLAIDVGTTTLVGQIIDLQSGKAIATFTEKNPQSFFGDDVISRIEYTMRDKDGLKKLQKVVIEGINEGLKRIVREKDDDILKFVYEVVVVGNPTMRNIFLESMFLPWELFPLNPFIENLLTEKRADWVWKLTLTQMSTELL